MDRRQFLLRSVLASVAAAAGWEAADRTLRSPTPRASPVRHLLPAVSDRRIRLKFSLQRAASGPPRLRVDGQPTACVRTDSAERFWLADVDGLDPGRGYTLRLEAADGERLLDDWPLRTFPAPDDEPDHLRIMLSTCAGGPEFLPDRRLGRAFRSIRQRTELLLHGLAHAPDVVVANGDHVYWDLRGRNGWALGNSPMARWRTGLFDRDRPVLGTGNEDVLTRAVDPQLADLYGTILRSTPVVFIQDDHDYLENDDLTDAGGTFPADPFMVDVARTTQRLYYPEFLPAPGMPDALLDDDRVSRHHGSIRFGRLFEGLAYDGRAGLATGPDGRFLDVATERWLLDRLAGSDAVHVPQLPSVPFGWTAGKWLEWYPDTRTADGLTTDVAKPGWSPSWLEQHDRIVGAAASRPTGIPLVAAGDLHASAAGWIRATSGTPLPHPVAALLVGTLGTGSAGWPSSYRGVATRPSDTLTIHELVAPVERNGFTLLDVHRDRIVVRLFLWSPGDAIDMSELLPPAHEFVLRRQDR